MHVCMYACMYVCTYVCTYVRMYVRTYVCMYITTPHCRRQQASLATRKDPKPQIPTPNPQIPTLKPPTPTHHPQTGELCNVQGTSLKCDLTSDLSASVTVAASRAPVAPPFDFQLPGAKASVPLNNAGCVQVSYALCKRRICAIQTHERHIRHINA